MRQINYLYNSSIDIIYNCKKFSLFIGKNIIKMNAHVPIHNLEKVSRLILATICYQLVSSLFGHGIVGECTDCRDCI